MRKSGRLVGAHRGRKRGLRMGFAGRPRLQSCSPHRVETEPRTSLDRIPGVCTLCVREGMTPMRFGDQRCDQNPPALSRHNPETAWGFVGLLLAWSWHACKMLLRGRLPELPSIRRAVQFPARTGGSDYRFGAPVLGGPAVFGGEIHEEERCDPGPEASTWFRVRGENWRRIGWTLTSRRAEVKRKVRTKIRRWKTSDEIVFH